MVKVYVDPGHGGSDPGAGGNGLKEKDVTLDIGLELRDILLNEYEDVQVKMSRTTDKYLSLSARANDANAWGADLFISIHLNAFDGTTSGYEDFVYNGGVSSATLNAQDKIHEEVYKSISELGDTLNRGQKQANFAVVRETNMPAVLSENLFIDSQNDGKIIKQQDFVRKVAEGHAYGVKRIFNLTAKKKEVESVKIQTGGLSDKNLIEVINYFQDREWYGIAEIDWDEGNPKVTSGGLRPAARKEYEKWLKGKGWYYKVI